MKPRALRISLPPELGRFLKEQVRTGRYQNKSDVVRDAIRQMQQRELEQFERLFGPYADGPMGGPNEGEQGPYIGPAGFANTG